jgi:hypothetical protein
MRSASDSGCGSQTNLRDFRFVGFSQIAEPLF